MTSDSLLAWVAGVLDARGEFNVKDRRIRVRMNDEQVIQALHRRMNGSIRQEGPRWTWECHAEDLPTMIAQVFYGMRSNTKREKGLKIFMEKLG